MAWKKKTGKDLRRDEDIKHARVLLTILFNRVANEVFADIHDWHDKNSRTGDNGNRRISEEKLIKVIPRHLELKD